MTIPNWNDPIIMTRSGWSKRLVGIHIGKRFDWWSPFALLMLIVLVGLFIAGAVLVSTELWYLGVAFLVSAIGLFLLVPVSRRTNRKDHS